jgi:monoamine oxidase
MTLAQYIQQNAVNAAGLNNLIRCWTQPGFGADPDELSFLYVLWYCACSGDETHPGTFERNSDTGDGAQQQRFVGGSQLVPLRLAKRLGDIVALAAPVHRIEQHHHHAVVHTARGPVRARKVVVAVPPPMVLDIDWHPHLPAGRRALMRHLDMGELMQCDAIYPTPFWRAAGLNGFGIADSGAVRAAFDNSPPDGSPGVLLAFVGGGTWRTYGVQSRAQRRTAVLQGFAAMFGDQALDPVDYVEHDWTHERWTTGGPVANYAPEVMTSFGPTIRRPFRHVHWAGTERSTDWTGDMDGAVRCGQRAAREVLGTV